MGVVHDLLESDGRNAALGASLDRRVVEAAAGYLADDAPGIGLLYSGWCQAALPHRRLPDGQSWQITTERVTLAVEPGLRPGPNGTLVAGGTPYGSRARLILLYLQTEALRTGSREVELGQSLREWLARMGIPQGGKSQRDVREQAERISRCRFTFHMRDGNRVGLVNQNVVDAAMFVSSSADHGQGALFAETARLSEVFFEMLKKHPVPVEEAAIRAINNNSVALDIYAWLAYSLHALDRPTPLSWLGLKAQFGAGIRRLDHFKARFSENLALALAVYREAQVEVTESGVTLMPSPPPVRPREKSGSGRLPTKVPGSPVVPTKVPDSAGPPAAEGKRRRLPGKAR